jgi:uncharacterized protein (DUF433 family)
MNDKKKKMIRDILRYYADLLALRRYRIYSRFKTEGEDKSLRDSLAIIHIDEDRKVLYLKLNVNAFNRMKKREIKRYLLHELLHSFFSELSIFFESTVDSAYADGRKRERLKKNFDKLEHRKINYLINLIFSFDTRLPK